MAWTSPRTWVAGNVLTAAQLNVDVRDNENALSTHAHGGAAGDGALALSNIIARRKTVAQTVTTTSPTSDNAFSLTIAGTASEIWSIDIYAYFSRVGAASGNNLQFKWNVPASGVQYTHVTLAGVYPGSSEDTRMYFTGTATGGPLSMVATGSLMHMHTLAVAQGTSGTFQLLWSETVNDTTGVTMTTGSYMIAHRIQ